MSSIGSLATCLVRLVLGGTLFGFADIFVFNWIFSGVFGSLGSQGEHCLDLPTYLSSILDLQRRVWFPCLVRSVLRENTVWICRHICLQYRIFSDVFGSRVWFARFSGRTLFGFADIFVFNIGSSATCLVPVFGSLGSQGEHCLDLPTYLSSTGSLATCLVRAGLVSGLLFFEFEICLFGRLATCLDHLDRSLLWEKNATPCELFFYHFLYYVSTLIGSLIGLNQTWILYLSQGKQNIVL